MPTDQLLLLALGAAIGGFVQGISGFAFGMVAMSIWAWGIDPKLAVVLSVAGGLSGQILSTFTVRRALSLGTLWPYLAGALAGIPLGLAVLPLVDVHGFRLGLGAILLLFCPLMLLVDRLPAITWGGRWADGLVGAIGGVMGGLGGFTGVAPSLWTTLRNYDKDVQRGVLQNFNLAALTVTLASHAAAGNVDSRHLAGFAVVLPALIIPSVLGVRVYRGLSPLAFRRVVLLLLIASGVVLVAGSLGQVIGRR
ncbi:MAG TPA: sulfite exporter TauE/SafE family protein [Aquabacterium sp.]|nr:sulfite exporter TauE/SafE family protein [Aquabacterium sp.]HQC96504.1 sulfite exporter TauE/SafE family protein [Aquabacterium sp.]